MIEGPAQSRSKKAPGSDSGGFFLLTKVRRPRRGARKRLSNRATNQPRRHALRHRLRVGAESLSISGAECELSRRIESVRSEAGKRDLEKPRRNFSNLKKSGTTFSQLSATLAVGLRPADWRKALCAWKTRYRTSIASAVERRTARSALTWGRSLNWGVCPNSPPLYGCCDGATQLNRTSANTLASRSLILRVGFRRERISAAARARPR
jgi:hypothetical protein